MPTDRDIMEDCDMLAMTTHGYSTGRDITRNKSVVSEDEREKQIGKKGTPSGAN